MAEVRTFGAFPLITPEGNEGKGKFIDSLGRKNIRKCDAEE
jgi:hypothetical protein